MLKKIKIKLCRIALPIVVIILALPVMIIPLMNSGFIGDDTLSSLARSSLVLNNKTVLQQYIDYFNTMSASRLTVLQLYFLLFVVFGGKLIYLKLWVAGLFLVMLAAMYGLTRAYGLSKIASLISCICLIGFIQFRDYGDPLLAFYGITPLSIIVLLLGLCFTVKYNQNTNVRYIILGNLMLLLSILTYEYNIAILAILLFIIFLKKRNNSKIIFMSVWPAVIFALAYVVLTLYFRGVAVGQQVEYHSAYAPSFDYIAVLKSFSLQLISSLPFSNIIFKKIPYSYLALNISIALTLSVFFALIAYVLHFYLKTAEVKPPSINNKLIDSIGLINFTILLIFVPAAIISISPKYQSESTFGNPYTNSLYFSVGLSILCACLYDKYLKNNKFIPTIALLIISISYGLNYVGNSYIVDKINEFWGYPRQLAQDAMISGIFSDIGDKPVIISSQNYPWSIAPFYKEYSGINVNQKFYQGAPGMMILSAESKSNILSGVDAGNSGQHTVYLDDFPFLKQNFKFFDGEYFHFEFENSNPSAYYLKYIKTGNGDGVIASCRIRRLIANQDYVPLVLCDNFRFFAQSTNARSFERPFFVSIHAYATDGNFIGSYDLDPSVFQIQKNKLGVLGNYKARHKEILIDPNSISLDWNNRPLNLSISIPKDFFKDGQCSSDAVHFRNSNMILSVLPKDKWAISICFSLDKSLNSFQPEFSHVIGNHPGRSFDGFVFQKSHMEPNTYELTYGNGEKWNTLGKFNISDQNKHRLQVSYDGKLLSARMDGKKIGLTADDYSQSSLPLQIGGTLGGGRSFIGNVYGLSVE